MLIEEVLEFNPDAILLGTEYESDLIGVHTRFGSDPVAAYRYTERTEPMCSRHEENDPITVLRLSRKDRDNVAEYLGDAMFLDGHDDCIFGIAYIDNEPSWVVYDRDAVILNLREDMTEEEAIEFFDFKIIGAWVGEQAPGFITL